MNKLIKPLLILLIACILTTGAHAADAETDFLSTASYLTTAYSEPDTGALGGDWAIIGLARSGLDLPSNWLSQYYDKVCEYTVSCGGVLHSKKSTEYSRVILGLTAAGYDATNVAGYDLTRMLGDFDFTVYQGINGAVYALLALDSGNYSIPDNPDAITQASREMYIDFILSKQLSDGGFALSGSYSDPDVTATVMQALSRYTENLSVASAVDRALVCLSNMQNSDGGYSSYGAENAESCAQVVMALCSLDISLDDPDFVKNGNTSLDALLKYRKSEGGFSHINNGQLNAMATEQSFCALVAYNRLCNGKGGLYWMSEGLPEKDGDVRRVLISSPGMSFADISGHPDETEIKALIERGIINGMGDGTYSPDSTMTRAQFAAITVRAMGLNGSSIDVFYDVPQSKWYSVYISSAFTYGIITGRSSDIFDPEGTITNQEAAVMVARAAKLFGLNCSLSDDVSSSLLSEYSDGGGVSSWAARSVAYCIKSGILEPDDNYLLPKDGIGRSDIADMLYNLLKIADML